MTMTEYDEVLRKYPAPASPQEVLDLKPNIMEDAQKGPDPQISPTTYVEMTKPDGSTFLAPLSNVPYYEWKGFTAGAEQEIEDLSAYWAEKGAMAPVTEPEPPPADPPPAA